jgi:hypothetical protein
MIKPSYDDIVRIELDKLPWDTVWPTTDTGFLKWCINGPTMGCF